MTFHRSRRPLIFDYKFSSNSIHRVDSTKDLGVLLDVKLDFVSHIHNIAARSSSMLGFIKRWSKEFNSIDVTKQLYVSLVRPILEYASSVWSPYYATHVDCIESVQRKFLRFALRSLPWEDPLLLPPYRSRLSLLGLLSLRDRRAIADVTFLHQLLNDKIDSVFLRQKISFRENNFNIRQLPLLHINTCRTNFSKYEPINRMCLNVNSNSAHFELNLSKYSLKKHLHDKFLSHV